MLNPIVTFADLPPTVKGMVVKTFDDEDCYTVIINSRLTFEQQRDAYMHEMAHMEAKDFDEVDRTVDDVEMLRHYAI